MHRAATGGSYAGALISIMAGLSLNEWGVLFGMVIAAATFANNWYYKHRNDNRLDEAHRANIDRLVNDRRRADVESTYRRRATDGKNLSMSYSRRSDGNDWSRP